MSQIQNLRTYIAEECEATGSASLVDIMARFDFLQHSIPTLNEMRQAINGIEPANIERKDNVVLISIKNNARDFPQCLNISLYSNCYLNMWCFL